VVVVAAVAVGLAGLLELEWRVKLPAIVVRPLVGDVLGCPTMRNCPKV